MNNEKGHVSGALQIFQVYLVITALFLAGAGYTCAKARLRMARYNRENRS